MNNKVNYTLVGFVVLLGIAFILGFSYWMLKPSNDAEIKRYVIYFDESVLGLNLDAPVKYRGISVGKVSELKINPKNTEQVKVVIDILKTTPVRVGTAAKLTAQGITGLSYINLSLGSHNSACLDVKEGDEYPVIQTKPSFFKNFENSFGDVSTQLSMTLARTQKLLDKENQDQITLILQRSAKVMEKIDRVLDNNTINHLHATAAHVDEFTDKLNKLTPNIDLFLTKTEVWEKSTSDSIDSIMVSYVGLDKSMDEIQKAFHAGATEFKNLNADVLPSLNATMLEMQSMMIRVEEALEAYNSSPSDILYKRAEIRKAPGEEE